MSVFATIDLGQGVIELGRDWRWRDAGGNYTRELLQWLQETTDRRRAGATPADGELVSAVVLPVAKMAGSRKTELVFEATWDPKVVY